MSGKHHHVVKERAPGTTAALRRLGDAIAKRRIPAGISQEDLADRSGLSVRFLRRVERGTGNPSLLTLMALAAALGTPLEAIIREVCDAG